MSDNSFQEALEHEQKMITEVLKQDFVPVTSLGLIPFKDGHQWCYLFGKDLQSGVAGFGDTPHKAMLDFNKNYGS